MQPVAKKIEGRRDDNTRLYVLIQKYAVSL